MAQPAIGNHDTTEHASSRRLRLVEAHGYNGLALLTLYDGWRYFEPSDIEGFIAFELHRGVAVACGDPVCAEGDLRRSSSASPNIVARRGWRFTFVGASARVGKVAAAMGLKAVKIGEEPFFDLSRHSLSGRAAKKARSAMNLARRTGITVEEYTEPSPAIDSEIEAAAADGWPRATRRRWASCCGRGRSRSASTSASSRRRTRAV